MELERDFEELRKSRNCDTNVPSRDCRDDADVDIDIDKEIVIRDLDHCRYKVDHITVKTLPANLNSVRVDPPMPPNPPSRGSSFGDDKPVIVDTLCDKEWGRSSIEFSIDKDLPDVNGGKVYDFEMSKARTLPIKLSPEEVRRLKCKWLCILSLAMSTILLLIIVIVVLVHYS